MFIPLWVFVSVASLVLFAVGVMFYVGYAQGVSDMRRKARNRVGLKEQV